MVLWFSMVTVEHLFISSGHYFFGPHSQAAADPPMVAAGQIECVAGRGGVAAGLGRIALSDSVRRRTACRGCGLGKGIRRG